MANKKISELQSRTPALSDLMLVGDPSSGYSYKCTVTALATIIETDIADGFVTIGTTQTVSGAKTFSNNLTLTSVANTPTDPDKFLTLNASNVVTYRTGAEVLSDIGGQGSITLTTTGTSGAATLVGNTLNIPNYGSALSGYVPYTGATTNVNLGTRTITANGVYSIEGTYVANTYGLYGRNAANNAYNLLVGITAQDKVYIDVNASGTIVGGTLTLSVINNATIDTDTFLVSDSGVIKYRTGSQLLSDIGGQAALTNPVTGTGTTNYIPKFTSSSAIGNSIMYEGNNGIGIGTSSPAYKLDIKGGNASTLRLDNDGSQYVQLLFERNTTANSGADFLLDGTNGTFGIRTLATYPIVFSTSASAGTPTERLRISSTGLVGIGTSTPGSYSNNAYNLVVGGTLDAGITIFGNSAEGSSNLYLADGTTGDQAYRGFLRYTHSNDALTIGTSGITRMTLDASGNLGLGLTPNTWAAGQIAFEFGSLGTLVSTGSTVSLQNNSYNNGTNNIRKVIGEASSYSQSGGAHIWQYAASGASGSTISFSEAMRITSGGNVLVGGTSDNGSRLQVTGAATFSSSVTASGGFEIPNGQFYRARRSSGSLLTDMIGIPSGTDDVRILTTGDFNIVNGSLSNILTVKNGGNVGIGVTPSAWGSLFAGGVLQVKNSSLLGYLNNTYLSSNTYFTNSTDNYIASGFATRYVQASGQHRWETAPSGTAGAALTWTQAMTLDASGRLGIATTSPSYTLDVAGSVNVSANNFFRYNGDTGIIGSATSIGGANTQLGIRAASDILFATNGANERMRITSGGNVGIGTTGDASYKLLVKGNNASVDANGQNTLYLSAGTSVSYIATSYIGGGSYVPIAFEVGGSERMRITSGGEVYIAGTTDQGAYNLQVNGTGVWGAGAYVNGSDSALKQNIQPLDNSLDLVKQMKPVTYTYKESYSKDTSVQTGFIAQDLQILLKDKNYLNGIVKDGTYLSVAYQNLIPLLVKAIQEQQIEIEKLKNK